MIRFVFLIALLIPMLSFAQSFGTPRGQVPICTRAELASGSCQLPATGYHAGVTDGCTGDANPCTVVSCGGATEDMLCVYLDGGWAQAGEGAGGGPVSSSPVVPICTRATMQADTCTDLNTETGALAYITDACPEALLAGSSGDRCADVSVSCGLTPETTELCRYDGSGWVENGNVDGVAVARVTTIGPTEYVTIGPNLDILDEMNVIVTSGGNGGLSFKDKATGDSIKFSYDPATPKIDFLVNGATVGELVTQELHDDPVNFNTNGLAFWTGSQFETSNCLIEPTEKSGILCDALPTVGQSSTLCEAGNSGAECWSMTAPVDLDASAAHTLTDDGKFPATSLESAFTQFWSMPDPSTDNNISCMFTPYETDITEIYAWSTTNTTTTVNFETRLVLGLPATAQLDLCDIDLVVGAGGATCSQLGNLQNNLAVAAGTALCVDIRGTLATDPLYIQVQGVYRP